MSKEYSAKEHKGKSFESKDAVIRYITDLSVHSDPLQDELKEATLAAAGSDAVMIGAPEVLQLGQNLIHLIGAKRCLDVGTFTGASALAWALASADDSSIVTFDVDHKYLNEIGMPILQKRPELFRKIDFRLGSALETLDSLIAEGQSGTFDFAFIDADKVNYPSYYEKCVTLLRSGGIVMVDNALWGRTAPSPVDFKGEAIDSANRRISADPRTRNSLIPLGDGVHLAFKI